MNEYNENILSEPTERWGGSWTEKKLDAFSKYVKSYLTIMNKHRYLKTIYFDGFAGSGTRKEKENTQLIQQLLITEEEERTYKGAAERVLSIENLRFDYYYFIDLDKRSLEKLKCKLRVNYSQEELVFRFGDANQEIIKLANALKTDKYAALVFLDPFGMQINWESIKHLAETRSDVWILVPTGVIINRLLDKRGELKLNNKLESFFGLTIQEIKEYFYREETIPTLFGEAEIITKVSQPIEKIGKLYAKRMKTIWDYVTEEPLVLRNSNNTPIFHFIFASNNETAKKIATQIIDKV